MDGEIASLAARQSGVVSRAQLREIGASASAIRHRVAAGRLHPLHRGVYAVGHRRLERRGRWLGAVLACGPGAVLSHRSAAALWEIGPLGDRQGIDVTLRSGGKTAKRPIVIHRVRSLRQAEVALRDGIRCTSVARTLVDLAATRPRRELERACERAEVLRLFDLRAIEATLRPGLPGSRALRSVLGEWAPGDTITRSELEERFLALIRGAGLPAPQLNARLAVGGGRYVEVDALWPARRLVVELDGRATHGTRRAFERDRERDVLLARAGYQVVRFTYWQVTRRAGYVSAALAELLEPRTAARAPS